MPLDKRQIEIYRYRVYEHLETYVNYRGKYCPPDIKDFDQDTGKLSHQCPLCGIEHHNYESKTFSLDGSLYNTYICAYCEPEVHMVDLTEEVSMGIVATTRINDFLTNGNFPSDALEYENTPNLCVWCTNHVDVNHITKMPLPVGITDSNYHGVSVCKDCAKFVTGNELSKTHNFDNCHECGESYSVTKEEFDARSSDDTLLTHLCSDCGLNYGLTPKVSRFEYKDCNNCKKQFVFDKSIALDKNINTYSANVFICNQCIEDERVTFNTGHDQRKMEAAILKLTRIYGVKHSVHIQDMVHTLVMASGQKFTFQVIELGELGVHYKVLHSSQRTWDNIEDACTEGVTYAYTFINTQIKLFE